MKQAMKMKQLALMSMLALAAPAGFAQTVAGNASTAYVVTGASTLMGTGYAGISMPGTNPPTTNPVDQSGIVSFKYGPIAQANTALGGLTGNGYIVLGGVTMSETWKTTLANGTDIYAYRQIAAPLTGYPHFGGEVIAKVPGYEVYFGEWAPKGSNTGTGHDNNLNMSSSLRTVYYVGENPTTSMPTLTNAQYDVVGIRKYDPDSPATTLSTGTLTANYGGGSGTLKGTLTGGAGTVFFGSNALPQTTISSNGTFQNTAGTIQGQFYGSGAEALAGIYNAGNSQTSVAFGGVKQ